MNNKDRVLLAAAVNLDIDYKKMADELMTAMTSDQCKSFSYVGDDKSECNAYSLFLRKSSEPSAYSYRGAKTVDFNTWSWDDSLNIPYTRSIIDQLPFKSLGTVRVVYFPDIPCMTHTDWDNPSDLEHTLGLSIIPSTGNTYCNVWSEKLNKDISIHGHAMLLNDSVPHWVPKATGTRITMRVFGEIDYNWFNDKIDYEHCYYI